MARPKLGEGETQRLHLKISEEETQAIDDWSFANRIRSRSEAIRRLCQMALTFDKDADKLLQLAYSSTGEFCDYVGALEGYNSKGGPTAKIATAEDLHHLIRMHSDLAREVMKTLLLSLLMRKHKDFRDAATAQIIAADDDSELWNLLDQFISLEKKP